MYHKSMKLLTFTVIALFNLFLLSAQDDEINRNHMGIGFGASKMIGESGLAPAFHLHYSRSLSETSPFSFAGGFEMILDEHKHSTLGLGLGYNFWKELSLGTALGMTFLPEGGIEPGLHLELAYEFDLKVIDLGPMIEYGIGPDETHIMFGIHTGVEF